MSDEHLIGDEPRCHKSDKIAVAEFADGMLGKLKKNSHKKHWSLVDCEYLFTRLLEEVDELAMARSGTLEEIIDECYDVANFAMMIADNLKNGDIN